MPERTFHVGPRSPEYTLLGFLYGQQNHGYALHQQLITEFGYIWHVSQSHTYAVLKRMAVRGYISSAIQEQEKLPARQLLQLTESGRRHFEEWLHTPSRSSMRAIRVELITRLYFARIYNPGLIEPILKTQSVEVEKALTRLINSRKSVPREQTFNRLSLELRIRELRSVRDWLIICRKAFEKKSKQRTT
jgi:DNA-binding PadR family transcriptional regulator